MNLFIVIFKDEIPSATLQLARSLYGDGVFELTANELLIRAYIDDPTQLGKQFGIQVTPETSSPSLGVVFKLNGSYSGYYYANLWDWLTETRERLVG